MTRRWTGTSILSAPASTATSQGQRGRRPSCEGRTVLAEIDDTDYKVAVERARADFMDAPPRPKPPLQRAHLAGRPQQPDPQRQSDAIRRRRRHQRRQQAGGRGRGSLVHGQGPRRYGNADLARYAQLVSRRKSPQQYDQANAASISANAQSPPWRPLCAPRRKWSSRPRRG